MAVTMSTDINELLRSVWEEPIMEWINEPSPLYGRFVPIDPDLLMDVGL